MEMLNWIEEKRKEAQQLYSSLPQKPYRYGLAVPLDAGRFAPSAAGQSERVVVVSDNAEILTFGQAAERFPEIMKQNLSAAFGAKDRLSAFHAANWKRGIVVRAPAGTVSNVEIALPLGETQADSVVVIAEESSVLNILQKDFGDSRYRSLSVDIVALGNSQVSYSYIQDMPLSSLVINRNARIGRDACVKWYDAYLSSSATKSETVSMLEGDSSSSFTVSLSSSSGSQQLDVLSKNLHIGKSTSSDIFTRAVVDGSAVAVFRGNITIAPSASGSNGYQKEDILLLSKTAKADAIPELEINNHDVKCSHGATIGHIDPSQLFYLSSRGISREEAAALVVSGFLEESLRRFPAAAAEEVRRRQA